MCRKVVLPICLILLLGLSNSSRGALVGWWNFDDGSGSIATDSSGNGYDGTITGATWVDDGTRGYVLDFEDADYVAIPSGAFNTITSQVTVALWQYGDAAFQPQDNNIFQGTRDGNRTLNAHVPWGTGSIIWDAGYASTYDRISKAADSGNQYEGQWNHWAFTKNTSTGQMKIYYNGTLWHSGTGKTKSMSGTNLFKIGSNATGTMNYDGMISDFRVYNTVLTETEIRALAGWTCTISGTIGTVDDVEMNGLPGETITSDGGAYTATVEYGWNGTVVPTKEGYLFSPVNKTYSNVTSDQTNQDYTPTRLIAADPSPASGVVNVSVNQNLSWTAGALANPVGGQAIYFGTSFDLVNSRDASVFIGYQDGTSYDPGTLTSLTTYYWAIDSINNSYPDSPWAGEVWSFTTINTELVGYWRLNEGTGTIATDTSGYGNNGTITGAAWLNDGVMGNVLDFEGVDYVTIPSAAFSSISSQITIALWQYGDAALQPQNNSIFEGTKNGTNRVLNAHVPWGSGSIFWDAGYTTTYDRINKAADSANQYEGQWNHWAFTKNTATGQMKIYLNGELWHSGTGMTKSMSGITSFKIGSVADGTSNYDGMICEFRLYNVALSDEQISALVGQNSAANPSPEDKDFNMSLTPTLSWTPGQNVAENGQEIYLGTDYNVVANRDVSVYVGAFDTNSYSPSLKLYTNYYWAVDIVDTDAMVWYGDVWSFKTRPVLTQTEGYYKDVFFDGGTGISAYESLAATTLLGLSGEFVKDPTIGGFNGAHYLMTDISLGSWDDDNGVLLYPDGDARFRVLYVGGGDSMAHADSLLAPVGSGREDAQDRVRTFYANGGGYVGNCAGAAISFEHLGSRGATYFQLFDNFKGDFTNIAASYTDFEIPNAVKVYRGQALPKSPLLKYYDFGGDFYINSVRQNGGNWCKWWDPAKLWPSIAQVCAVYNDKIDGVVVREGYKTTDGASIWAYKRNEQSGRICPCGGHPEGVATGEQRELEASMFAYAIDGGGCPVVKAALSDGVTRQMNNNSSAGHEKVGDKQYHHFTITVPQGASQLQIVLDGTLYDLNLYAKNGDFAFNGEANIIAATNGSGCDETITIQNPSAGTWYIGVKCVTVPTRTKLSGYYQYTGNFEVLNGLSYSITATVQE